MEDRGDLEFVVLYHGPTTSILASKDGTAPSRKIQPVKVRVADLAPLSPYIIRVANERTAPASKPTRRFKTVRVNFLKSQLIWKKRFVESDGTLDFTDEDIEELLGDVRKEPSDVFLLKRHPFHFRAVVMFSLAAALIVLPLRAISTNEELQETKSQIVY